MPRSERRKAAIELLKNAPPAEWVREMSDHYQRTGTYRASDIRRVMGDQTVSVKVTSDPTSVVRNLAK